MTAPRCSPASLKLQKGICNFPGCEIAKGNIAEATAEGEGDLALNTGEGQDDYHALRPAAEAGAIAVSPASFSGTEASGNPCGIASPPRLREKAVEERESTWAQGWAWQPGHRGGRGSRECWLGRAMGAGRLAGLLSVPAGCRSRRPFPASAQGWGMLTQAPCWKTLDP